MIDEEGQLFQEVRRWEHIICKRKRAGKEPSPEAEAELSKRKAEAEAAARLKALRSEAESLSKKIQALEQQQDLKR